MKKIPVFYSEECCAPRGSSRSPSMQKPALAVRSWQERGFAIDLYTPSAASLKELKAAHDRDFVDGVLCGRIDNGFGNRDVDITRSLPYTSGAMMDAARYVVNHGPGSIACAPVSGFHHAGWSNAGGFCTFNGLMVAALSVLDTAKYLGKPDLKVGILDYDMHYGDGTVDILDALGRTTRERIKHRTFGGDIMPAQSHRQGNDRERALAAESVMEIPATLRAWKAEGVGLVLYQAGADPHVNDPLGGVLTSAQLAHRDELVFETCKELQLPVAWCLAGGYMEDKSKPAEDIYARIRPTLDIHDNTMRACMQVYCDD